MSDTPRTDEACILGYMRAKNFACQLERELNAALAENTAMREAIKTAHDDLLNIAVMPEYDQDDSHRLRNLGMKAASKLQPFTTP
jgi:hypothetical protein